MSRPPDGAPNAVTCPTCATVLPGDSVFCLQCGSRLPAAAPNTAPFAPGPAAPRPGWTDLTPVFGTATVGAAPSPVLVPSPPPAPPVAPPPAPPVPVPNVEPVAVAPEVPATGATPRLASAQRTMIGLQRDELAARAALAQAALPPAPAPPPAPAAPPPAEVTRNPDPVALRARAGTMIGVAAPLGPSQAPPGVAPAASYPVAPQGPGAAAHQPFPPAHPRREPAPMLGGSAALPGGSERPAPTPRDPAFESADLQVPGLGSPRRGRAGRAVAIGLAVFAVVGGGGYAVSRLVRPAAPSLPTLAAEVRSDAEGDLELVVTVPGAAPGTRVRQGPQEATVQSDGRATLPLTLDADAVGAVSLPVEVMAPGGAARAHVARVLLAYRVTPELQLLAEEPPRVHLRFRVPEGAQLFVAGQPVSVAQTVGIAEIPGPAMGPPDAPHRSTLPVRVVTAEGQSVEGTYTLRVPRVALRVVEPGRLALVRGATAVVAGTAPGATRVRVGSVEVNVSDGRFRAEVPVNPGAQDVSVTARGPGVAPTQVSVRLLRDVTEAQYLGPVDPGVAALLNPSAPRGQRLSLRGQVLDSRAAAPDQPPTFQLLVTDRRCPQGRCVVWVDVPHGAVVATRETVRVVGETAGTRAYTNAAGERRSDPVVQALTVAR